MAKQKGLQISTDLGLPLDAVTATMVVYGGKGMGKTNFGGVFVEELSSAAQKWAVLDPMGVWWGIRHSEDGKGDGLPCLILGGALGDIPIEPTGGAVVADLVADETANVVIDISRKANGEMWSIAERIRFANDYGKQLFRRQGSLIEGRRREPMMQVIDEAARFIPQMVRAGQPELAMCTSTWSTIVEEGRNVGLGVTLLTQRSARLNKDVAELADVMLAFRTVGPNSLEAVTDWLSSQVSKQDLRAMAEQVRSLPVGSCLLVSPGWLKEERVIAVRKRSTYDSSATPKPGQQRARVRGTGARPDLGKYTERMRETIERAKEDSVPELKKRIRDLERAADIAKKIKPTPITVAERREMSAREKTALIRPFVKERQKIATDLKSLHTALGRLIAGIAEIQEVVSVGVDTVLANLPDENEAKTPPKEVPARPTVAVSIQPQTSATQQQLTGKALQIASIASGYGPAGITKKLLAAVLGVPTNGSFYNRLSEARVAGAVVTEGDRVVATDQGVAQYAGAFRAPSTTQDVIDLWRPKLTGKAREIFDVLVAARGSWLNRAELAERIGVPTNGSFYNRLSEVRQTGLLKEDGKRVAMNPELLFL